MVLYATGKLMKEGGWPLKANGIEVPRLRGYLFMSGEKPVPEDEIEKIARMAGRYYLNLAKDGSCYCKNGHCCFYDKRQARGMARRAYRRQRKQLDMFNRYCGRSDVLHVHARVGGRNWKHYGCSPIEKHPRYLGRCDDGFDQTYCDIYFRIE